MAWHLAPAPPGTLMASREQGQPGAPVLSIAWNDDDGETRYLIAPQHGKANWVTHENASGIWVQDPRRS
jgi:hypothetical protein